MTSKNQISIDKLFEPLENRPILKFLAHKAINLSSFLDKVRIGKLGPSLFDALTYLIAVVAFALVGVCLKIKGKPTPDGEILKDNTVMGATCRKISKVLNWKPNP